jgi:hypothetical protein
MKTDASMYYFLVELECGKFSGDFDEAIRIILDKDFIFS